MCIPAFYYSRGVDLLVLASKNSNEIFENTKIVLERVADHELRLVQYLL